MGKGFPVQPPGRGGRASEETTNAKSRVETPRAASSPKTHHERRIIDMLEYRTTPRCRAELSELCLMIREIPDTGIRATELKSYAEGVYRQAWYYLTDGTQQMYHAFLRLGDKFRQYMDSKAF
jgi:hypothetical protein